MKKILHVLHRSLGDEAGGVQTNLWSLIPELEKLGLRSEVLVPQRSGWDPVGTVTESLIEDEEVNSPFPLHQMVLSDRYVRRFEDSYLDSACHNAFEGFLRSNDFDIVHFHHLGGLSVDLPLVARQNGLETLFTLHDYFPMCLRGQMTTPEGARCERPDPQRCAVCVKPHHKGLRRPDMKGIIRLVRPGEGIVLMQRFLKASMEGLKENCDRFIAPSAFCRERYIDNGFDPKKIRIVPYGLNLPDRFKPARTRKTQRPKIGYLGSFSVNKGLGALLSDPVRSAIEKIGATLDLYGGTMDELLELTEAPPTFVHVRGPYRPSQVWEILKGLDLLIVPSQWEETYNIVLREGLACGLPIVASRIGGMKEAIDEAPHTVFPFPPGDVGGLADALVASVEAVRDGSFVAWEGKPYTIKSQAKSLAKIYNT